MERWKENNNNNTQIDFLKSIILTATFCIVASSSFSQTQVQLQDAFSKSYVLEAEKNMLPQ